MFFLMAQKIDVNRRGKFSLQTPLMVAMKFCFDESGTDAIKILLQRGADVHAVDCRGSTAFHMVLRSSDVPSEALAAWIEENADVNVTNRDGNTILHEFAMECFAHPSLFKMLLKQSPNIKLNVQNQNGDSALHLAVGNDNYAITMLLIEAGADTGLVNKNNETPMHLAGLRDRFFQRMIKTSMSKQ